MRTRPRTRAGYTLVEVMVVLAILGVMAAAAVPALGVWLDRDPTPAEAVAGLLRDARARALHAARPVTVTLGPAGEWVAVSENTPLAEGRLTLNDAAISGPPGSPQIRVRFGPSGGADGGPVVVLRGERSAVVRADRWTGEVTIDGP
ncbi:MAG: pilus assembly FimT family protein [Gemmatimonadota bacterium]